MSRQPISDPVTPARGAEFEFGAATAAAVSTLIRSRRSASDFLPDAVPGPLLDAVLAAANWAPSGSNTQPYRVAVATGAVRGPVPTLNALECPRRGAKGARRLPPWRRVHGANERRQACQLGCPLHLRSL